MALKTPTIEQDDSNPYKENMAKMLTSQAFSEPRAQQNAGSALLRGIQGYYGAKFAGEADTEKKAARSEKAKRYTGIFEQSIKENDPGMLESPAYQQAKAANDVDALGYLAQQAASKGSASAANAREEKKIAFELMKWQGTEEGKNKRARENAAARIYAEQGYIPPEFSYVFGISETSTGNPPVGASSGQIDLPPLPGGSPESGMAPIPAAPPVEQLQAPPVEQPVLDERVQQEEVANVPLAESVPAPVELQPPAPRAARSIFDKPEISKHELESEQKELAKDDAGTYKRMNEAGELATKLLPKIDDARNNPPKTGAGANLKYKYLSLLDWAGPHLGMDALSKEQKDDLFATGKWKKVLNELTIGVMEVMKGVQSDKDLKFFEATFPNISDPQEVYEFTLNAAGSSSWKDIEARKFSQKYRKEKGYVKGLDEAWENSLGGASVFGKNADGDAIYLDDFMKHRRSKGVSDQDAITEWKENYAAVS